MEGRFKMILSAIVPVYNAEKSIKRCLDSVLAQTYADWELIAVDDGSTDRSLSILNAYAQHDSRIKVLHQSNSGAGMARNAGIDEARGDYLVFIDSDDYIEKDYFQLLSTHRQDVVFIDVNRRNEAGKRLCVERMTASAGKGKDQILREQMTGKFPWGGVRKAVSKAMLDRYSIRYSNHSVGEEAIYSFQAIYYANTISFIDIPVYNYCVHQGSLSQTHTDDPWGAASLFLKDQLTELGLYKQYADTINAFILTACIISVDRIMQKYSKREGINKAKQRIQEMKAELDTANRIDYKHMSHKARLLAPFVLSGWVSPFYYIEKCKAFF